MFDIIKDYYSKCLYTREDLNLFVKVGFITNEEKEKIIN